MSLFVKFKNALGFGPQDDDYIDDQGIDATVTPIRERFQRPAAPEPTPLTAPSPAAREEKTEKVPSADAQTSAAQDESVQATVIFDRVLEIFNGSLPEFLEKSVDPAKQRQLLFEALDGSTKDYFNQLERNVERRLQTRFEADRYRLQSQIDTLKQQALKDEEDTSAAKTLQLSAERQKRALSERVHDLEKQLASLEAENEQFILENKTMANKLRLASISDSGEADSAAAKELMEKLEAEKSKLEADKAALEVEKNVIEADKAALEVEKSRIEAEKSKQFADRQTILAGKDELEKGIGELEILKEKLEAEQAAINADREAVEAAKKGTEDTKAAIVKARAEVEAAKAETDAVRAEAVAAKTEAEAAKTELARVKAEAEAANGEISKFKASIEQAKLKDELSQAMVNDLNSKAVEARKAFTLKEREVEELTLRVAELSVKKKQADARLVEISDQKADVDAKLAEISGQKADVDAKLAEITAQKADVDARLVEITGQKADADAKVADLNSKIAGMSAQISDFGSLLSEKDSLLSEKESELKAVRGELVGAKEQLHISEGKLAEAQENLKVVREVEQQVSELENAARTNDARLRAVSDELMEKNELLKIKDTDLINKNTSLRFKDETIKRLEDQTDSLRKSIENLTFEKEQTEAALRQEIERLKQLKVVATAASQPDMPTAAVVMSEATKPEIIPGVNDDPFGGPMPVGFPQAPFGNTSGSVMPDDEAKLDKLPIDAPSSASDTLPELSLDFANSRKPVPDKPKRRRGRPPKAVIPDEPPADYVDISPEAVAKAPGSSKDEVASLFVEDTPSPAKEDSASLFADDSVSLFKDEATAKAETAAKDGVTAKDGATVKDETPEDETPSLFMDDEVPAEKPSGAKTESAYEDLGMLDSTDWLISEPEPERPSKRQHKTSKTHEDEFGYKEIPRQEPPDSPAQMLLW